MDVKEGHCWRCNSELGTHHINCEYCQIAEYCSLECSDRDTGRHHCVECPTWSPKCAAENCSNFASEECSDCYTVWYCSDGCRTRDGNRHRPVCHYWQGMTRYSTARILDGHVDFPFYFSNSFPKDLLNLRNNELKEVDAESTSPASPRSGEHSSFRVLLSACGDLRHVFQTAWSLPIAFKGRVTFALNDIDPFAMARNVLLLYLVTSVPSEETSSVATIWLSALLSNDDSIFLQRALSCIIAMSHAELRESTARAIDVHPDCYDILREVWVKWESMISSLSRDGLLAQRRELFGPGDPCEHDDFISHLEDAPTRHIPSIRKWLMDGVIAPQGHNDEHLTRGNPTFTGRDAPPPEVRDPGVVPLGIERPPIPEFEAPSRTNFIYCVRSDIVPYAMWDYLEMVQFRSIDSITEMCHAFTADGIDKVQSLLKEKRLSCRIFLKDFQDLGSLKDDPDFTFDRIFTSNLIDYYSRITILSSMEPLISHHNPHAVLLSETINWHLGVPGTTWPMDWIRTVFLVLISAVDRGLENLDGRRLCGYHEYYNNMDFFITFLRGEAMSAMIAAGESRGPRLPTMEEVMSCQRLRMRDFRKGRNKVVPFTVRAAARTMNMLSGDDKTIEWYRNPQE